MVLCIVQARLNSQRFPRKVLADLHGKPLIVHVVERALQIAGVDRVVVATGARWDVLELSRALRSLKVDVLHFTGVAENDVLGRFAATLALYPAATTLMRVTGDCPMLNPAVSAAVLRLYQDTPGCEYAWNVAPGYIDGEDTEVFSARLLRQANRLALLLADREHVGGWMRRAVPVTTLAPSVPCDLKTSVDTPDDLARVAMLMGQRV